MGISLPKDWAKGQGIEPGATLIVVKEDDGTLRIRATGLPESEGRDECVLDADTCERPGALRRLLIAAYVVGKNSIRVKSRTGLSATHLAEVQEATRSLTGLTVVNQEARYAVLENFAEPTRFPIEGLLRRLHFLTSRMGHLGFQPLRGETGFEAEEISRLEDEADRLYWLVCRQLLLAARDRTVAAKIGVKDPRNLLGDRVVAIALETIADLWYEVGRGAEGLDKVGFRPTAEFRDAAGRLEASLSSLADSSMTSFFATSLSDADMVLNLAPPLLTQVQSLRAMAPTQLHERLPDLCASCGLVIESIRPIGQVVREYARVAQLTMNRALEADQKGFGLS